MGILLLWGTVRQEVPVGVAVENDRGTSVSLAHAASVGLASEKDAAAAIGVALGAAVTVAVEKDAALTVSAALGVAVGVAVEKDLAPAVHHGGQLAIAVGVSLEADTAPDVGAFIPSPPVDIKGRATHLRVGPNRIPVTVALEIDHALLIRSAIRPNADEEDIAALLMLELV